MGVTIITPRGDITIRPAREEDIAAYRELRLEALRDHPEAFSSDYETQAAWPLSRWAERLSPPSADGGLRIWFAEHAGGLVGMCGLARAEGPKLRHSATLVSMYVCPGWRSLHIGERLVTACLEWARGAGVSIVKLAVVATNIPAIRCYARCGFRVYGVEPQALCYGGIFYDELLMAKTVAIEGSSRED